VLAAAAPTQARSSSEEDAAIVESAAGAVAEPPAAEVASPPAPDWYLESSLSARVNPLSLLHWARLGYRWPLLDSPSPFLQDTRFDVAADVSATPAYVSGGAFAEITPLAILKLRASVQRLYYFGTLGCISELPDGDWSPERLKALEDADSGRAMPATRMELGALLQAAIGPVVAFVDNAYAWVLTEVDDPYYDPYDDLLLDPTDGIWSINAVLGVEVTDGLLLGGRWERLAVQFSGVRRQTVGILAMWDVPASWMSWGSPRVAALVGLYVVDRYRLSEPFGAMELSVRF
jgi:hypothetical protein